MRDSCCDRGPNLKTTALATIASLVNCLSEAQVLRFAIALPHTVQGTVDIHVDS